MSELVVDTRMIRVDDGKKGLVVEDNGEKVIVYLEHGEPLVAGKREKWIPDEPPRLRLRVEEKLEVALWADRALEAIEKHEPFKTWEKTELSREPYCPELVLSILNFFTLRGL